MKFLIVFLAVVALAHAEENEWTPKTAAELRELRQECLKEHPLSDEAIEKVKHLEFVDEEPVRQFLLCTYKATGTYTENEGFNAARMAKQFKMDMAEAEVLAIIEGCIDKNEQKSPADVWALRLYKCAMASKIGDRARATYQKELEHLNKST